MPNALIFGVSGAIGAATADAAIHEGFCVYGLCRTAITVPGITICRADIRRPLELESAIAALPPFNLIVFCQGMQPALNLASSSHEHVLEMFETHVIGTMLAMRHLLPKLADRACVVMLSSNAAKKGSYDPAYAAAKGAIVSLTTSLAKELKSRARVNCIAPGLVAESPVHCSMKAEHEGIHRSRMFMNELVHADEVASLVLEIYRNESISGAVIPLDRGYSE